jgi:hypothetical protein
MLYRLMSNINKLTMDANLKHKEISEQTGRAGNWVNRVYNNNSDITMSSFSKILSAISRKVDMDQYKLTVVFDHKILEIANVMSSLADEDTNSVSAFIISERDLFSDLMGDWGALNEKRKLSKEEKILLKQLQNLLLTES